MASSQASSLTDQRVPKSTTATGTTGQNKTIPTPSLSNSALHEDLPLLVDDENHNNFPEWNLKVYILLRTWGILKYIKGPSSAIPDIPVLCESITTVGFDRNGVETEVRTKGNADEYNRKFQEAKLWMEGNDL